jgi:hypothetical protein
VTRVTSSSTVLINDDFLFHVIRKTFSYSEKKTDMEVEKWEGGR